VLFASGVVVPAKRLQPSHCRRPPPGQGNHASHDAISLARWTSSYPACLNVNRSGFAGGCLVCVTPPWPAVSLGIVAVFGLGGRDISDRLEQAMMVEPVDPLQGCELDALERSPRAMPLAYLDLEQMIAASALMRRCRSRGAGYADGTFRPAPPQHIRSWRPERPPCTIKRAWRLFVAVRGFHHPAAHRARQPIFVAIEPIAPSVAIPAGGPAETFGNSTYCEA
jgi:hypothetical protein